MYLNKPPSYWVLFGAPLLVAAGAFLGSLYFVTIEGGITSETLLRNQQTTSVISDPPVRLEPLISDAPHLADAPSVPIQSMSEPPQETPMVEPETPLEPPFYKPNQEDLAKLNPEQLVMYNGILEDYLKFYAEWSKNTPDDVEAWNNKVRECNQQIRFMLGREAYNLINFR